MEDRQASAPVLTQALTMWKAGPGFNASHGASGIFIGIIYFYGASQYFSILQSDHFFFLFNIITIGFYAWLAKKN